MDQSHGKISFYQAMDLAIKMHQADAFMDIAYFLRRDGEFQESMTDIAKSIKIVLP